MMISVFLRPHVEMTLILFCFDTETTGLDTKNDRIIEFAAVAYDTEKKEIIFEEDVLIDPMRKIPEEASKINHITDEMIKKEAVGRWIKYGPRCRSMLKRADVWIGQNIDYDISMLTYEFERTGDVMPQKPFIDTMVFARRYYPNVILKSKSLGKMMEYFSISMKGGEAHRALPDTIATLDVLLAMLADQNMTVEQTIDPTYNKMGKHMIGMDPFEAMIAGLSFGGGR